MIDYAFTGPILTILPIFLLIVGIIYRNKIKKVIIEFLMAILLMFLLLIIAGFAIAVLNVSLYLLIILLAGLVVFHRLAKLNIRDTIFVGIFLLLVIVYEFYGYFSNAELLVFVIGIILIMVMNIYGLGKDEYIPYK